MDNNSSLVKIIGIFLYFLLTIQAIFSQATDNSHLIGSNQIVKDTALIEWADTNFQFLSNKRQATTRFEFFQAEEDNSISPKKHSEKVTGYIHYIVTPETWPIPEDRNKLLFKIKFIIGAERLYDAKLQYTDDIQQSDIQTHWYYFPTDGRIYETKVGNTNLPATNPNTHERYYGKTTNNIGGIKMIAANGNRVFALTEEGNLFLAVVADISTVRYIRNDPHGSTAWNKGIREEYEEYIKHDFGDFGYGVMLKEALGIRVEKPFLWYQTEMPKLHYSYNDDNGNEYVIDDEIIDIAVSEIFKKTSYERKYNADYHNNFTDLLRNDDAGHFNMLKYSDFFDGTVTFFILVERKINNSTPQYIVRWTDEHSYTMMSYHNSGPWRDLDLRQPSWPKVRDFKIDGESPTWQNFRFKDVLPEDMETSFIWGNIGAFSVDPLAVIFGYPIIKNGLAKHNKSVGNAFKDTFLHLYGIHLSLGIFWVAQPYPPLKFLAIPHFIFAGKYLIAYGVGSWATGLLDDTNISSQGKFYITTYNIYDYNTEMQTDEKLQYKDYKDPYNHFTTLVYSGGELEPYYWDPAKWWDPNLGGKLNRNSQIDATHEHLLLSTDGGDIYSIAFNYGAVDFTWRSRPNPINDLTDNVRLRDDMVIFIKGVKDSVEGFYYQPYLSPSETYEYINNPFGLPPPTGEKVTFNHSQNLTDWEFVPYADFTTNIEQTNYNIAFTPEKTGNEEIEFQLDTQLDSYFGLNTALVIKTEQNGQFNLNHKPLDHIIVTKYVMTLPVEVLHLNPYLKELSYSINGSPYMTAQHLNTTNFASIVEAQQHYENIENNTSLLLFDSKADALLVSPHFKEGYNNVTFHFKEYNGLEFNKDLSVMQLTVPPFIKPIFPLLNQYTNLSNLEVIVKAQDILGSDTPIKPENWFSEAAYNILVDGLSITNHRLNLDDNTVRFNLDYLSDGNHIIQIEIDYQGLKNSCSWRFWVDTKSPEITFPDKFIFSNKEINNKKRLFYLITDTVPYHSTAQTYAIDTVLLTSINAKITDGYSELLVLDSFTNSRLGSFINDWDGRVNEIPLQHGIYTLEVSATDRVGNQSVATKDVIIDNQAPYFASISLNHNLLNLESEKLELSYRLDLDSWEEKGNIYVEVENIGSQERFTLDTEGIGEDTAIFTLDYFNENLGIFKDGVYNFKAYTQDEIKNKSESVLFRNIVIDLTKPKFINTFINPFVLDNNVHEITLQFKISEEDDVSENISTSLPANIKILDQFGNVVHTASQEIITPNTDFIKAYDLYSLLKDGKYYVEITVTDKNGNKSKETVAFIKNAMPPEIIFPDENDIIQGITTIYGNIVDPKWNNNFPFGHYELYYKTGLHSLPTNLHSITDWDKSFISVPAYQQKNSLFQNFGYFPIEGNNIIGNLDTTLITEGPITILVISEEVSGYRIGAVRSYHVLKAAVTTIVDVQIDPTFKQSINTINFAETSETNITYAITHNYDNPVDLYSYVKDKDGRIIRQTSFYNLKSTSIKGLPTFNSYDNGVYIYQDNADRFFLTIRNTTSEACDYNLLIKTTSQFINFYDQAGNIIDSPQNIADNNTLVISTTMEPNAEYVIGFTTTPGSELAITAIKGEEFAPIYMGQNKTISSSGYVVLFGGSTYPPINWDGKDEWGRYVVNGIYTVGVEAYGKNGGYDEDSCLIQIETPFIFNVTGIDNKNIQIGILSLESSTVQFRINKGAKLQVEVLDANNHVIKNIFSGPKDFTELGLFSFTWFGTNNTNQYVPASIYSYKLICTPLDTNISFVFDNTKFSELGNIQVTYNQNLDPTIKASIFPYVNTEEFNGRQVVQGDNSYEVLIEPQGQNLPDKTVYAKYDIKGTQAVDAYPDLNYMAAFRTNFKELWAQMQFSQIAFDIEYVKWQGLRKPNLYELRYSPQLYNIAPFIAEGKVASYDISFEPDPAQSPLQTFRINFQYAKTFTMTLPYDSNEFGYDWTLHRLKNSRLLGVYTKGKDYMNQELKYTSVNISCSKGGWKGFNGDGWTQHEYIISVNITGYCEVKPGFDKATFLSFGDGVAVMGPDIQTNTIYAHKTPFINKGKEPVIFDLINMNPIESTGMAIVDETNCWRKDPSYHFYYLGENYFNNTGEARDSVKDLVDLNGYELDENNFGGNKTKETSTFLMGVSYYPIPENFSSQTYPQNGKVQFTLSKTGSQYSVTVSSDASDKILYPFPITEAGFNSSHEIGDSEIGIPQTHINGERDNENSIPNYVVPEHKLDTPGLKNVYFQENISTHFTAVSSIVFNQETGYQGQISLTDMLVEPNTILPQTINIKKLVNIYLSTPDNDVQFIDIPSVLYNSSSNTSGILINDSNIYKISNSSWSLYEDSSLNERLSSGKQLIDFDKYNRYGIFKEERIANT